MNPPMTAVRAGIRRGGIELRQTFTNAQDLWGLLFWPAAFLIVMFFPSRQQGTGYQLLAERDDHTERDRDAGGVWGSDDPRCGAPRRTRRWDAAPGQGDAERCVGLPRRQDRPDFRGVIGLAGDHSRPRRAPFRRPAIKQPRCVAHPGLGPRARPGGDDAHRCGSRIAVLPA